MEPERHPTLTPTHSHNREAWDIETEDAQGGPFTKNLCDGFAWHNNDHTSREGVFINWSALGWSIPATSDDDLSGVSAQWFPFPYGLVLEANSVFYANGGLGVTMRIPADAELGSHTHLVKVCGTTGTVLAQSSFTFEVVPVVLP